MKIFTALAALTLIAAPAQALPTPQTAEQAVKLMQAVITENKAGNWSAACLKYKETHAFRAHHKLDQFIPVTGSAARRNLIHEANAAIARINSGVNETGRNLCGKAGITWTHANLPTVYSPGTSVSTVSNNIRTRCEKKWGTNYRMIKYCVDKQTEAARSLGY